MIFKEFLDQNLIMDIAIDSRLVKPGSLFFVLRGGDKFIQDAINNGAAAIISEMNIEAKVPVIKSVNIHADLVYALQKFYPNLPKNIFAITGTKGKTSTAEFLRQMLEMVGYKAASIGTLGIVCNDIKIYQEISDSGLTTPDIVSLYKNLAVLKKHGIDNVAIEASSIGIEQGRLDGIKIEVGIFSNFSQDHLDYHLTMKRYFDCKMLLFKKLMNDGIVVANADIIEFSQIKESVGNNKLISFGKNGDALKILSLEDGRFLLDKKEYTLNLSMIGDFQIYNALSALLAIKSYYNLPDSIIKKIVDNSSNLKSAKGRMDKVADLENGVQIYIDFAHNPDSLEKTLNNAKRFAKARLLVLFGCGGDRDTKKRPIMGEISTRIADYVIITDDNPRTENPAEIRSQIITGCINKNFIEIDDRKNAIGQAITMLKPDDILIIAGKGHEQYQIIGDKKYSFNEEQIVKSFL